jgi:hypothetical protein
VNNALARGHVNGAIHETLIDLALLDLDKVIRIIGLLVLIIGLVAISKLMGGRS